MKVSYNWLKELLPELTLSAEEVAETLTRHSFETVIAGKLTLDPTITVVKITAIASHPNADRLKLATVSLGTQEITVVCGAPNIAVGQVVPYSPPGATLTDNEGNALKVKKAKIRGVKSPGMLNSLRELGLHPSDHSGIWVLPDDTPVGSKLSDHVPSDTILEADITPNRAHDCLSHLGIARELAALLKLSVKEPPLTTLPETNPAGWSVTLADPLDSPRYLAATLDGATVGPSPLWLQARLLAMGGKPINNLVDITNYVLFELGSPTHLFDAAHLPGQALGVRRAQVGEKITALDEKVYELTADDLVITSDDRAVAIAGIMGGLETGVSATSTRLVLEVANFRAFLIQETARRLNLRSEASARFSKQIHPAQVELAARRTLELLRTLAGANITGMIDAYPRPQPPRVILFDPARVGRLAGTAIATTVVHDVLQRLRCTIEEQGKQWRVTVPLDRLDVEGEHDLAEEVIRVFGLNEIPASTTIAATAQPLPPSLVAQGHVRAALVALGFTETLNYSFESERYAKLLDLDTASHLNLSNPPAPELARLRVSLLPGVLANMVTNRTLFMKQAGRKESALFEIGNVYRPAPAVAGENTRVPGVDEVTHVAGIVAGTHLSVEDITDSLATALGVDVATLASQGSTRSLAEKIQQTLKYQVPLTVFEYDLSALVTRAEILPTILPPSLAEIAKQGAATQFVPYSQYPAVWRDLSLLVDAAVSVEQVQNIIERVGGTLLKDVDLFDEYQPEGSDRKGLAFHLMYQSDDRTLTNDEVATLHNKIVATLQKEVSAEPR